jgi:hypothetical protein
MKKIKILLLAIAFSTSLYAEVNPTILFVGDSHSYGKFGTTIEKNLSKISDHIIMESSCVSTPSTWLGKTGYEKTVCGFWKKDGKEEIRSKAHKTPKISDELSIYRPEITIVQLGTNIAAGDRPINYTTSIETLMKTIKEEKSLCIWIGPPDANSKVVTKEKLQITNTLLKTLADKNDCLYIDSLLLTTFPKSSKEGIHYPTQQSSEWGEKVSEKLLKIISEH